MNRRKAILDRAERTKRVYPKRSYIVAQLALAGDDRAGLQFMDMVSRPRRSFLARLKDAWRTLHAHR